ncbi:hypothetical protein R3W88_019294 [Solanum pinnatisectum]|uniref:Ubiquitin-like protease family profile domain-containing protein n=1 Tax=Solanum pinnatisectum TaxID=50273 RepID=A0AAV9KJX5_9SOLN|nr:hypothetical protein R3W88_019294 [Solanum pinnatisectum]
MARGAVVSAFERSIKNIINGFSIPGRLPWNLVDDVYIPVNSDGKFHWLLVVVALKERLIRVYNSSLSKRINVPSSEIKKFVMMLPFTFMTMGLVAAFVEFLSDGIPIPKNGFRSKYLYTRYEALLWKYGTKKATAGYVSENDDPTRSKSHSTEPTQEDLVNAD